MANRFWVGGTGNTSSTSHWSATTGGGSGASVPVAGDVVAFDTNSGTGTVTDDAGLTCASITHSQAGLTVSASHAQTVTGAVTITAGTWITGAFTHSYGSFVSTSGTRTLTLTGSTINITGTSGTVWATAVGGLTFTATGSTINFTGGSAGASQILAMNALTFGAVNISGAGIWQIQNGPTFASFNYTSTSNRTDNLIISGNLTVNGVCTIAGNSSLNRAFITSNVLGTQRTITGGIMAVSNADFQDVLVTGQNVALQSNAFSNAAWTLQGAGSITANAATDPIGGNNGWHFNESNTTSQHVVASSAGVTVASGATLTIACCFKAAEETFACLNPFDTGNHFSYFNLSTGVVAQDAGGNTSHIYPLGNGWYLCTTTRVITGGTFFWVGGPATAALSSIWAGTTNNGVYMFGAAIDVNGSFRTYMPTTSAAVTALDLSAITGGSGDCLGNSGITFTPSVSLTLASTGTINWSAATWNGTTPRVPLPQDDVSLGSSSTATTLTADMPRLGRNIDASGYLKTLSFASIPNTILGNLTLPVGAATLSGTQGLTLAGRGAQRITSNGKSLPMAVTLAALVGSYTAQDAMNPLTLAHNSGTFNDGGHAVTTTNYASASSGTQTLNMTGIWTLTQASSSPWTARSGLTLNGSSSIINLTGNVSSSITFAGGGFVYGLINWSSTVSTGALIITGANNFKSIASDNTTARKITIPNGVTTTVQPGGLSGLNGKAGVAITLSSDSAGLAATLSCAGGDCQQTYLTLQDIAATGGANFRDVHGIGGAGNDGNVSGNTGWTFGNITISAAALLAATSGAALGGAKTKTPGTLSTVASASASQSGTPRGSGSLSSTAAARATTAAQRGAMAALAARANALSTPAASRPVSGSLGSSAKSIGTPHAAQREAAVLSTIAGSTGATRKTQRGSGSFGVTSSSTLDGAAAVRTQGSLSVAASARGAQKGTPRGSAILGAKAGATGTQRADYLGSVSMVVLGAANGRGKVALLGSERFQVSAMEIATVFVVDPNVYNLRIDGMSSQYSVAGRSNQYTIAGSL